MSALTLRELASRLDLSIATVSRALAGDRAIAAGTRQRVTEAAHRYGYVPNIAARQLDATAGYNWLDTDSVLAFGEAFELLYGLGHRHFALVSISDAMTFRHMRERGLREAISRRGDPGVTLDIVNPPRFDRGATI